MSDRTRLPTFWWWLLRGKPRPGWMRFFDRWMFLHIVAGFLLAFMVPVDLRTAGSTVLLPLVGVLIGLSFAWAGNAQALLQAEEIEELTSFSSEGFEGYVFTYQAAILAILTSVVLWGLAALGIFDQPCPWRCPSAVYFFVKVLLYVHSSATLRECWQVVIGAQMMLLARRKIRAARRGRG